MPLVVYLQYIYSEEDVSAQNASSCSTLALYRKVIDNKLVTAKIPQKNKDKDNFLKHLLMKGREML